MNEKIECFQNLPGTPKAVGPYSPAVRAGNTYFLSGQVGLDPQSGTLVSPDVNAQTQQVLANVKAVLSGIGLTLANVVKSTVFLTDMANFQAVNGLYAAAFGDHKPARSTIQVSALPLGALVEIEVIAVA
jgi:2-iminobutanoate/2-iminopropanoate deaminase